MPPMKDMVNGQKCYNRDWKSCAKENRFCAGATMNIMVYKLRKYSIVAPKATFTIIRSLLSLHKRLAEQHNLNGWFSYSHNCTLISGSACLPFSLLGDCPVAQQNIATAHNRE